MFSFFRRPRPQDGSAQAAKDRLQILLAHERVGRENADLLPLLQRDILEVVKRRMKIESDAVDVRVQQAADLSTLEINIEMPGAGTIARGAA
jgi:cell division topological specificity factor